METLAVGTVEGRASGRKLIKLTIAGGSVFWATTVATSLLPIAGEYRAALGFSQTTVLFESLFMGMMMACLVSYCLLRFFDRLPPKRVLT